MSPAERERPTELIPPVPEAVPDPFPYQFREPVKRRRPIRDRSGAAVGYLIQLVFVASMAAVAFVAGQLSVAVGAAPPPQLRPAAEVQTEQQLSRMWPVMSAGDRRNVCDPWREPDARGWQGYVLDRWSQHLASPAGGQIDVDRATVARFIDRACSREGR